MSLKDIANMENVKTKVQDLFVIVLMVLKTLKMCVLILMNVKKKKSIHVEEGDVRTKLVAIIAIAMLDLRYTFSQN